MSGEILVEHRPAPAKLEVMGVYDWAEWEKEASEFPWSYETGETCYFLAGRATITPEDGEAVEVGEGDLVRFPAGLRCTWTIHEAVRKHYQLR
ncbi:MAG: cupin domain-containing protein [Gammaproteobacteria bacterium]|jgi:hypothetical protein|nr:cupin domain-containing protein [Gammaproteobacteria bacterium]